MNKKIKIDMYMDMDTDMARRNGHVNSMNIDMDTGHGHRDFE
jgi:hypothetical protein